jgi:hypothetical protein
MNALSRQEVASLQEGDIVYVRMEVRKPLGEFGTVHCRIANEGRRSHYVPVSPEHIFGRVSPRAERHLAASAFEVQAD